MSLDMARTEIRVAQLVSGDLRPYRLPLLERLARKDGVRLTVFAGQPAAGIGAPSGDLVSPVALVPLVNRYWPGEGNAVFWQSGAFRILRSDADVVILPEIVHNLSLWVIRLLHRRVGKRLIVTGFFYRSDARSGISRLSRWLRRRYRSSASALIAYTERGRRECIADGEEADKIFVSNNTLDVERLRSIEASLAPEEVAARRKKLGLEGRSVLLYVGRLLQAKRVDLAIAAAGELHRQGRDVTLLVVGDGPERDRLRAQAAGLPVTFVGAEYDEHEVALYCKLSDLLVLPGRVGLSCVHGFAHGLPCVTTADGLVAQSPEFDYVADGVNGLVATDLDAKALARRIAGLLDDEVALRSLQEGARRSGDALSMDVMADAYITAVRRASRSD